MPIRVKTIALDFDGTCVQNDYPNIGDRIGSTKYLIEAHQAFHIEYMLWTMRTDTPLANAMLWLEAEGIPVCSVNVNRTQHYWSTSPKRYANLYIEDTALGIPQCFDAKKPYVDWAKAGPMLLHWCQTNATAKLPK